MRYATIAPHLMAGTLERGSRLGPYEVVSPIGGGGMGEVYRGRDIRLDRSVAIKILPAELAQDAQFKLRFEREAKAIAQLNHPNICTLYDVGREEGVDFLVLELLDGESLADRLARGPLPLADVLKYGIEIAEALDRAHAAHIVHRDLKPGNVVITKSGAKLLDFGLAKSSQPVVDVTDSTQQKPLTREGAIVGTFQYMAPEQLEGVDLDHRTDIFAFGAVLYEMLTGRRAFEGKTKTSVIAAIVAGTPPPANELQPLTPPALEHVIRRCLVKDPDGRWQSARDIAEELRWITSNPEAGTPATRARRSKWRQGLGWAMNAVTALVAVGATWWIASERPTAGRMTASAIRLPAGTRTAVNAGMAISPDATQLVIALDDMRGSRSLWIRPLAFDSFRRLEGTEDASYPFWSPDSRQIGFFATGKLKTIDATGGSVRVVADAPGPRGGAWNGEGTIVFAPALQGPLMKVAAGGGPLVEVTRLDAGEEAHRWPLFLADGKRFLYVTMTKPGRSGGIFTGSVDGRTEKKLVVAGQTSMAVSRGHLFYGLEGEILAQKFDERSAAVSGPPLLVIDGIAVSERLSAAFSAAEDGTLVAQRGTGFTTSELVWVDRTGSNASVITPRELFFSPRLSRDGRRLAVDRSDPIGGQGDIWIYDLQRNAPTRLTFKPENESGPAWSPDDRFVVYHRGNQGDSSIEQVPAGGTGRAETLISSTEENRLTHVSRDGRTILFDVLAGPTLSDIWTYSVQEKKASPWLATPFAERGAELSPDGHWIAYQSDESGQQEIYVRGFPESDRKWLITTGGGTMPSWRGDGREIFYIAADGMMMSVAVTGGETFEWSAAVPLFDAGVRSHANRQYDVTPDGSRFLLNRVDRRPTEPLTLISNWSPQAAR
jgi:eukaryotic-like serine/threonine-protein kinase